MFLSCLLCIFELTPNLPVT